MYTSTDNRIINKLSCISRSFSVVFTTMNKLPHVPGLPYIQAESQMRPGPIPLSLRGRNETLFRSYWTEFQHKYKDYIVEARPVSELHPQRKRPEVIEWCIIFKVNRNAPFIPKSWRR
jgi:hypothetical protein